MSEFDEHKAVIEWAQWELNQGRHPELAWLYHTPNGEKRDKRTAAKLAALGVRAGIPDLFLPLRRGNCGGLWLELKTETGRVTHEQLKWHVWLRRQGHIVEVCRSWEQARDAILAYLSLAV